MSKVTVQLKEWERLSPFPGSALAGTVVGEGRAVAEALTASGKLEILELSKGLQVQASSWVGRIDIGDVSITIQPKIPKAPILPLLRYAYGLRQLELHDGGQYALGAWTFHDLIVHQLACEVEELISRGLHRDYRLESAELGSPKGRVDFQQLATASGRGRASLPCLYYPRTRATLINQVVLSGLLHATRVTVDLELRIRLRRLGQTFDIADRPLQLHRELLEQAWTSIDRRTHAYEPTLTLIGLLMESTGISLDEQTESVKLPGFLFDMNRFFQSLVSKFLRENLAGHTLVDEHRLHGMFSFDPSQNPKQRSAPTPRPDFVVLKGAQVVSVLDAKYRDLWEHSLPAGMLYQLALYALGHSGSERQAVILYPTLHGAAPEQAIILRDPLRSNEMARVILRPVNLLKLEALVKDPASTKHQRATQEFAFELAFGVSELSAA